MTVYEFRIEETKRDGYIAWDAIDEVSGDRFPVNEIEPYKAGTFPEITNHLKKKFGVNMEITYSGSLRDSLDGTTWTYNRSNDKVIVKDIPRTIFRIEVGSGP